MIISFVRIIIAFIFFIAYLEVSNTDIEKKIAFAYHIDLYPWKSYTENLKYFRNKNVKKDENPKSAETPLTGDT
jgi:hypothetical protein